MALGMGAIAATALAPARHLGQLLDHVAITYIMGAAEGADMAVWAPTAASKARIQVMSALKSTEQGRHTEMLQRPGASGQVVVGGFTTTNSRESTTVQLTRSCCKSEACRWRVRWVHCRTGRTPHMPHTLGELLRRTVTHTCLLC